MPIPTIATTSTAAFNRAMQAYLLAYVPRAPLTGGTIGSRIGGRLYHAPPDTITYPYGLMRLMNRRVDGAYAGDRDAMELELQWHGRPASALPAIEALADVADQAFQRFLGADTLGVVFSRQRQRDTLPPFPGADDRPVVVVRQVVPLIVWPAYLYES